MQHSKQVDTKSVAILAVGAILLCGGSFFAGVKYASLTRSTMRGEGFGGGSGNRMVRFSGGGTAFGKVLSTDDTGITLQLQGDPGTAANTQGAGSKIILINGSTQIQKSTSGTASDLSEGQSVMVHGIQNADGSITAQNIQIRPATNEPR